MDNNPKSSDELRNLLAEIQQLMGVVRAGRYELDIVAREADEIFAAGGVSKLRYDVFKERVRRNRRQLDKFMKHLQYGKTRAAWLLKQLDSSD